MYMTVLVLTVLVLAKIVDGRRLGRVNPCLQLSRETLVPDSSRYVDLIDHLQSWNFRIAYIAWMNISSRALRPSGMKQRRSVTVARDVSEYQVFSLISLVVDRVNSMK